LTNVLQCAHFIIIIIIIIQQLLLVLYPWGSTPVCDQWNV